MRVIAFDEGERKPNFDFVSCVYCLMASSSSSLHDDSLNAIFLTEHDIPDASLLGRKPEELKTMQIVRDYTLLTKWECFARV